MSGQRYGKPCSHGKPPGTCTECRGEASPPAAKAPPPIPVPIDRARLKAEVAGRVASGIVSQAGAGRVEPCVQQSLAIAEAILVGCGL